MKRQQQIDSPLIGSFCNNRKENNLTRQLCGKCVSSNAAAELRRESIVDDETRDEWVGRSRFCDNGIQSLFAWFVQNVLYPPMDKLPECDRSVFRNLFRVRRVSKVCAINRPARYDCYITHECIKSLRILTDSTTREI